MSQAYPAQGTYLCQLKERSHDPLFDQVAEFFELQLMKPESQSRNCIFLVSREHRKTEIVSHAVQAKP